MQQFLVPICAVLLLVGFFSCRYFLQGESRVLGLYIVALLIGGLIGFLKGKSKVSLIMSASFAAVLVLTTIPGLLGATFARGLANVCLAVLLVVFAIRLAKTKKFMPAGLMLVCTIIALAFRNVKF